MIHSNSYGGSGTDLGLCGWQLSDGGFIIAGDTRSFSQGENDAYLVRTDNTGEQIWDFTFGGSEIDLASSCVQAADGGCVITGYTYSFGNVSSDVFLIKFETEVTGISELANSILPGDFTCLASFPNPFNSSTTISYTLSEPGMATLGVYNIQGQQVAELFQGIREAGEYSITWDALNYPSGVYIARLEVGGSSRTAKMVLLK